MITLFQERVYKIVSKIPRGKTLTYRDVARLAGKPKAYRAVGIILSKNYNPKIPCHRVIRSDGNIGGYNRGVYKKKELLIREGFLEKHQKTVLNKFEGRFLVDILFFYLLNDTFKNFGIFDNQLS